MPTKSPKVRFAMMLHTLERMKETNVNFYNLRRKFQPFLRTRLSYDGNHLDFQFEKHIVYMSIIKSVDLVSSTYISVCYFKNREIVEQQISVSSNKQLMEKIIHRYELLKL